MPTQWLRNVAGGKIGDARLPKLSPHTWQTLDDSVERR